MLSAECKPRANLLSAIFAHEVLRRIGIDSGDIYFAVNKPPTTLDYVIVTVVVRHAGLKWTWYIGNEPTAGGEYMDVATQLTKEWAEVVGFWNESAVDVLAAWGYSEHPITNMSIQATLSLHQRGLLDAPSVAARNILIGQGVLPLPDTAPGRN